MVGGNPQNLIKGIGQNLLETDGLKEKTGEGKNPQKEEDQSREKILERGNPKTEGNPPGGKNYNTQRNPQGEESPNMLGNPQKEENPGKGGIPEGGNPLRQLIS